MSRDRLEPSLLAQPAAVAAAAIVRAQLGDAERRVERLVASDDPDALHDFRVALRRTRSALRAYRPVLGACARKKDHRRLRDISRATNAGRDAEVQLDWLVAHRTDVPRGERDGLNALLRELRRARRVGYAEGRGTVRARFRHASQRLRRHLDDPDGGGEPLRAAFGTLLGEHARGLAALLAAVHAIEDRDPIHQARIASKRLRYLLEPMLHEVPEARGAIRALRDLQDLLGEQRDVDLVLAMLVERQASASDAGLARLARAAEDERAACWTRLGDTWLTPRSGGPAFLATLDDLGRGLAGPTPIAALDPRRHGPLAMTVTRTGARRPAARPTAARRARA